MIHQACVINAVVSFAVPKVVIIMPMLTRSNVDSSHTCVPLQALLVFPDQPFDPLFRLTLRLDVTRRYQRAEDGFRRDVDERFVYGRRDRGQCGKECTQYGESCVAAQSQDDQVDSKERNADCHLTRISVHRLESVLLLLLGDGPPHQGILYPPSSIP